MNPFSVADSVVLVTGAGANGGIGHAIALGFAKAGAKLAICDIDADGLEQTRQELLELGTPVLASQTDIGDPQQVEQLFSDIRAQYGTLNTLINVPFAFAARVKPHELSHDDWHHTLQVSLSGYFYCCQQALRLMLDQPRGGNIINIGSNAGSSALGRGALPYACAKAAVHQLTKELAVEYAANHIRCNAIVPAQVLTPGLSEHLDNPQFRDHVLPSILRGLPMGALLQPSDFVAPAIFLASDAASAVNGVLLPVDQGNSALNAGGSHNWQPPGSA